MANGVNTVPATTQNWPPMNISNAPIGVRQQAAVILADARFGADAADLVKAAVFPDSALAPALVNIDKIEAQLDALAETNPKFASNVRAEVMSKLSPVQQGLLMRAQEGVMKMGPDGRGFNYAEPGKGLSQGQWLDRAKIDGHPDYTRYASIAGSEDRAAMKQAMDDVYAGRAVMPQDVALTSPNWKDPNGVYRAQNGITVTGAITPN